MSNLINVQTARNLVKQYNDQEWWSILNINSPVLVDLRNIAEYIEQYAQMGKSKLTIEVPENYTKLSILFMELEELGFTVNCHIGQRHYPPPKLPETLNLFEIRWD